LKLTQEGRSEWRKCSLSPQKGERRLDRKKGNPTQKGLAHEGKEEKRRPGEEEKGLLDRIVTKDWVRGVSSPRNSKKKNSTSFGGDRELSCGTVRPERERGGHLKEGSSMRNGGSLNKKSRRFAGGGEIHHVSNQEREKRDWLKNKR